MNPIIVQMSERQWTEKALHVACAMARVHHKPIILLRLMQAQHASWLGTEFGYEPLSHAESTALWDYKAIADNYGVELDIQPMQYATFVGAVVDMVDALSADAVFADVPRSALAAWRKFQVWDLRRQLDQRKCALYTLDQPVLPILVSEMESLKRPA